jgi:dipeptidyl aminopeptidase/acylaminoacyl peptidase
MGRLRLYRHDLDLPASLDVITDFDPSEDVVQLVGFERFNPLDALSATPFGALLDLPNGHSILFVGRVVTEFSIDDFQILSSPSVERVSVSSAGEQGNADGVGPSPSADGRLVAYESNASNLVEGDTNNARDIFVFDRATGTTERVSVSSAGEQGNDISLDPSLSADGRLVAYESNASNLVEGDTNNVTDIFVAATQGFLLM